MSGHSKWSTIKRAKGAADAKRGMTFTKLANALAITAREGGSADPSANPRLRVLLDQARSANMPKDNVQRALDRGLGKLPGQTIDEVMYEGFGAGKVAFLVEVITDNKNRTLSEIKNIFDRAGGSLGSTGSVSYMFDKRGEVRVQGKGGSVEDDELELIDTGALDIENYIDEGKTKYLVYTEPTDLNKVTQNIKDLGFEVEESDLVFKANIQTTIGDKETAEKVIAFTERLEDHDDVQKVHSNFDIPEDLM